MAIHGRGKGFLHAVPKLHDGRYSIAAPTALPSTVDLTAFCPEVWNQGQTNSCTGHMLAALIATEEKQAAAPGAGEKPSPLFLYYNGRALEQAVDADAGCQIPDIIEALGDQGFAAEGAAPEQWPFDPALVKVRPRQACYTAAKKHLIPQHLWIPQSLNEIRHCLAVTGKPVGCGIAVYASFEDSEMERTGIIRGLPQHGEELMGWHAVAIVGYDDHEAQFIVRNSWGAGWGQAGYFRLPYLNAMHPELASNFSAILFQRAA